ncbi:MAG: glycosyltransferase [Spirulinaceae cyanobacterium]
MNESQVQSVSLEYTCPRFSLILPTYNEEKGILPTLDHLQNSLKDSGYEYEIIAVNDGSVDGTAELFSP